MLIIKEIDKNGIGKELKFRVGDAITAFDGHNAVDALDYLYYDQKEKFLLTLKRKNGKIVEYDIEKDESETLGLIFESENLELRTCHNNCIFCFVDQMPKGMRSTLYVKDDDYRQSFMCGNFVTLTNLTDEDAERIIRLKLSPLYISVHTMNRELRAKMMNNRFAGKIVDYINSFAKNGIEINAQAVICPTINDGKELDYTARELFKFYPQVKTMAAVPCGLTKYREGLTKIADITPEYALSIINQARSLNKEFGVNFLQLGDEYYFRAGIDVEPYEFYGDFPQIENGVGTTAKFKKELEEAVYETENDCRFLSVCGVSASEFIKGIAKFVESKVKNLSISVLTVKNKFFGETVNCTGLLTGGDILEAVLSYKEDFDVLVIPNNTLRAFKEVFIDDMTVDELAKKIGKPIRITDGTGESFFNTFAEKLN